MEKQLYIPHVQQSITKRNCGAACLCMILRCLRMRGTLEDVTAAVSVPVGEYGMPSCRNNLLIQYALSRGFDCCKAYIEHMQC